MLSNPDIVLSPPMHFYPDSENEGSWHRDFLSNPRLGRKKKAKNKQRVGRANTVCWVHVPKKKTVPQINIATKPKVVSLEGIYAKVQDELNKLIEFEETQHTFHSLVSQWKSSGCISSSINDIVSHPAYMRIIGMGKPILPLLLKELRERPDHWFLALRSITGENPVRKESRGNLKRMAEDWVNWGITNGIIE